MITFGHRFNLEGKEYVVVNGENVEYKDVVYNRVSMRFKFWDRIRILFGYKVDFHSRTYMREVSSVIIGEVDVIVWHPKKGRSGGLISFDDNSKEVKRDFQDNKIE